MKPINLKKGQKYEQADGTVFTAPYAGVYVDTTAKPVEDAPLYFKNALAFREEWLTASYGITAEHLQASMRSMVEREDEHRVYYTGIHQPVITGTEQGFDFGQPVTNQIAQVGAELMEHQANNDDYMDRLRSQQEAINRQMNELTRNFLLFGEASIRVNIPEGDTNE